MRSWNGVVSVLRSRTGIRRVMVAYACFSILEFYVWLVVVLWAYAVGGATLAGVAALAQLLPASLLAPAVASVGDRLPGRTALVAIYGLVLACTTLTWLSFALGWPVPLVLLAGTSLTTAIAAARPVHFATLPDLARAEPELLVAANSLSSVLDGVARFVGPVLAGIVVALTGTTTAMVCSVALALVPVALCARISLPIGSAAPEAGGGDDTFRGAMAGLRAIGRSPGSLALLIVMAVDFLLTGVLDILGVAYAQGALDEGGAASGLVVGALGIGALLGAVAGSALSQRRILSLVAVGGAVLEGVAFASTGATTRIGAAVLVLTVAGIGGAITIVSGRTLLQRSTDDEILARVFAVQESVSLLGLALGAVLAPILVSLLGLHGAWVPVGLGASLLALLSLRVVRRLDERSQWLPLEIGLLRTVPFVASLPPYGLERLAHEVGWRSVSAGEAVTEPGLPGSDLFVVGEGELSVWVDGTRRPGVLGPRTYFGEVAMLRGGPRTATVVAETHARLLVVPRVGFLRATGGDVAATELAQYTTDAYPDLA